MDGFNGDEVSKKQDMHDSKHDDKDFNAMSPTHSSSSTHGPPLTTSSSEGDFLDLILDGVVVNTSIEQLYYNVCEMQCSDYSPSRLSFLSYGEESRIDSELRFLAGGDYGAWKDGGDCTAEEVKMDSGDSDSKINPSSIQPISQMGAKGISQQQSGAEESRKTSYGRRNIFHGRPPKGKQGAKGMKRLSEVSSMKNEKSPPFVEKIDGPEGRNESRKLGPYLLKQARDMIVSGDNAQRALALSIRAKKAFEVSEGSEPSLDFVLCLHVVAALQCRLGRYSEAIPVLERAIEIPVLDKGQNHALAKFSGCMQLGDTYAMLGQVENSILLYTAGLEIQRQVLGENHPHFGETCRYLAEAHVQTMQFDEAEKLALMALSIHKNSSFPPSVGEAADRRLLGLICDLKGDYEGALEHYVLASMAMAAHGQNADVATIDCNIGDSYLSLARYDEAILAYQKALKLFKSAKGENHSSVASVFVRLANLFNKIGKFGESKSNCKRALKIYAKPGAGSLPEEIASGLVDISALYESNNEPNRAVQLLQKAMKVYGNAPGRQCTIAGIEAQMGVLYYVLGRFSESYASLNNAIVKFRKTGEKRSALFGIALNQLGLACVRLFSINEAADLFEEARSILEVECGPYHPNTLGVCSNLAGTYDAIGRAGDAIEILEYVVEMREEKLGTANPDVENEKQRLSELLQEAGMVRNRKSRSLETLLVNNSYGTRLCEKISF